MLGAPPSDFSRQDTDKGRQGTERTLSKPPISVRPFLLLVATARPPPVLHAPRSKPRLTRIPLPHDLQDEEQTPHNCKSSVGANTDTFDHVHTAASVYSADGSITGARRENRKRDLSLRDAPCWLLLL